MATTVFRPGDRPWVHLGLLGVTAVTTFGSFLVWWSGAHGPWRALLNSGHAGEALTFSFCLLLVLGSHEMGHYVLARMHGVDTSLPYFIPFPIGIGTLGAVIRIRARIPSRNSLVDIGAAGPIAGLVVAIPMMFIGVFRARLIDSVPMPSAWPPEMSLIGIIRELASHAPAPASGSIIFGDSLLSALMQRLVWGALPAGKDLEMNPIFLAAWVGMLVTMLNLIPIGQLDGGHLTHALFGRWAIPLGKAAALGMLALCIFASVGWLLWLVLTTQLIGFKHPEVLHPDEPLTRSRKWICAACAVGLILCVMPIPLRVLGG